MFTARRLSRGFTKKYVQKMVGDIRELSTKSVQETGEK